MQVTTIGLDIAKSVFPVHGIDARGRVVLRRRLARGKVLTFFASLPRCLIGLEACGARRSAPTSGGRRWEPGAHHWARELARLGHDTRLMPPQHVKAYVRTNKHDAADAEACCARRSAPTSGGRRWEPGAGAAAEHALRCGQEREPAGDPDAAPGARPADRPAHGEREVKAAARESWRRNSATGTAPRPDRQHSPTCVRAGAEILSHCLRFRVAGASTLRLATCESAIVLIYDRVTIGF